MRYDDTLETVLAADLSSAFGRQSAWRQLVDLIGRRRARADSRAIETLKMIRVDVPPPVRAASARMLEYADPPEPLARLFILDEIAIALPVLRSARLSSDDWLALLPLMSPAARSILRNRRDLGPRVIRALETYGPTDLVLADGRPRPDPVEAPAAIVPPEASADDLVGDAEAKCPEMGPRLVEQDDTGKSDQDSVTTMILTDPEADVIERDSAVAVDKDGPDPISPSRFVQVGAVALGLPVVAEAVRMAGDADEAESATERVSAASPLAVPGADAALSMDDDRAASVEAGDVPAESPILPVADALRLAESFPLDPVVLADTDETAGMADPADATGISAEAPDVAKPDDVAQVEDRSAAEQAALDDARASVIRYLARPASPSGPPALTTRRMGLAGPLGLAADSDLSASPDLAAEVTDTTAEPVEAPRADAAAEPPQFIRKPPRATIAGEPVSWSAAGDESDKADQPPVDSDTVPGEGEVVRPDLLDSGMGAAAVGGLAIMAAATGWASKLAGAVDADAAPADRQPDDTALDDRPADMAGDVVPPVEAPEEVPVADAADVDEAAGDDTADMTARHEPDSAEAAEAGIGADAGVDFAGGAAAAPVALAGLAAGAAAVAASAIGDEEPDQGVADALAASGAVPGDEQGLDASASGSAEPPTERAEADPLPAGQDGPFRIADVVARIDAYQRRQVDAPVVSAPVPTPVEGFRFEADAAGIIRWVEGVGRGPLIGLALDQTAPAGGFGFDAGVAGAYRHRASFSNARLRVAGESDAAGDWLVSAVPVFDAKSGRFTGYRGAARRPRSDERAEMPGTARPSPVESLRELIHELRTPAGAITGFAELIEAQMLGPVPIAYREQAMAIRTEARELLAIIDDLDFAARIEARALDLRPRAVQLKPVIKAISDQLAPLAASRGAWLALPAADHAVRGDERAIDRLLARLLATVVGAAAQGERIGITILRDAGDMVSVEIDRPAGLNVDAPAEPDDGDPAVLGTGFALRLAGNLARELGGALMFAPDRLTLRLPGADDPDVEQAVHH